MQNMFNKLRILITGISLTLSCFLFAADEEMPSLEVQDLIFNKLDQQTPININDDHIIIRKITGKEKNNLAVSGGNVYFEQDKAMIASTEHIKVEEISKAILSMNDRIDKVLIAGFSDTTADPLSYANLAERRAKAVATALAQLKVPKEIIIYASVRPNPKYQYKNIKKNRRVEILIRMKS